MREPQLSPQQFVRDQVLARETLYSGEDLARLHEEPLEDNGFRLTGSGKLSFSVQPSDSDLSRFNTLSLEVINRSSSPLLVGMRLCHMYDEDSPGPAHVSLSGGREELPAESAAELKFPSECFGRYGTPDGWTQVREIEFTFCREKHYCGPDDIDIIVRAIHGEFRSIPEGPRLTPAGLESVLKREESPAARPALSAGFPKYGHTFLYPAPCRRFIHIKGGAGVPAGQDDRHGGRSHPVHRRRHLLAKPLTTPCLRKHALRSSADRHDSATRLAELRLLVPPPHPHPKESADEILAGKIMGQDLGKEIQWDANPLGFLEWTHFLNRHHFVRELVLAFVRSGDDRYVLELDRLISDWVKRNPVPVGSNGGTGPAWETLSVAWRLREWLFVVEHAWRSDAFRESTKNEMLRSIWEHATSLMEHKGHPNNWIIVEAASLALTGLAFPEFKESDQWVNTGIERLRIEFSRQFFDDGVHFEISPMYHAICFHALLEVKLTADKRGVRLPDEFGESLERLSDYLAALCRPDFTWPSLNDSGSATQDYTTLMLLAGEVFQRSDLLWIGSRGLQGEPPTTKLQAFPDAGIAMMRTDFTRNANSLVFRAGPAGASHVHEDVLSLDLTALGEPRLVDPGITTYAPDRLTDHYRSAAAHNTILVNGKGRDLSRMSFLDKTKAAGKDFLWRSVTGTEAGPTQDQSMGSPSVPAGHETTSQCLLHESPLVEGGVEIVSGVCRGPWANAEHVVLFRTVYFVRGAYWIVHDQAQGTGEHEITVCWQFAPGRAEMDLKTFGARFVDLRGPSFEIIPLPGSNRAEIEVFTGSFRPPRGWVSENGTDMPAISCAYNFTAKLPITLVWLLIPFSGGPTCRVQANRLDNADGSVTVEVACQDGQVDRVALKQTRNSAERNY
jgi:hypothetical protein